MRKILIVDDLAEARDLLHAAVQKAFPDAELCIADSLASASAAIAKFEFDLALVDLVLGDGDGTDLIKYLGETQPNCLAVVASAIGDDTHLFKALQAGAVGYLLKDLSPVQLVFQLSGIAKGNLPLSPSIARKLMSYFQSSATPQENEVPSGLSQRETEVLRLLAKGTRMADIAKELEISHHTVGDHVKNIYKKLKINSRAQAALKAKGFGLI